MEHSVSTLKTNTIQASTGTSVSVADGHTFHQAGAVLQVVQATKTATVTVASGANAGVISQAITPKFATSKILVKCSLSLGGGDNSYGYARLSRQISGESASFVGISDQASGSQINCSFQCSGKNYTYQSYRTDPRSFEFLDSPNTTTATTYEINIACTSDNMYLNRSGTVVTDNVWTPATMSTLTLMEIAQ